MARVRGRSKAQAIKAAARRCASFTSPDATVQQAADCVHNLLATKNQFPPDAKGNRATDAELNKAGALVLRHARRGASSRNTPNLSGSHRRKRRRR